MLSHVSIVSWLGRLYLRKSAFFTLSLFLLVGLNSGFCADYELKPRPIRPKLKHTEVNPAYERADRIILKFHEGTRIRVREGKLVALVNEWTAEDKKRLARVRLTQEIVLNQIEEVNRLLKSTHGIHWKREFEKPEAEIDQSRENREKRRGEERADLNLFYAIELEQATPDKTEEIIDRLNAFNIVEMAYPQGLYTLPNCDDISPLTPHFSDRQQYLYEAGGSTNGIEALYAQTLFAGGRGAGVKIIDIEKGWNINHEDSRGIFFSTGVLATDYDNKQHGTAVLGVLGGCSGCYGVTGIVNQADIGISSIFTSTKTTDLSIAINLAAAQLQTGDVILIEVGRNGPSYDLACDFSGINTLPSEYEEAVFESILGATDMGIIVIEAAGNASSNLDCIQYGRIFDRAFRDSGAVFVGAGTSSDRSVTSFTNYGSRLDVQGWGENVWTAGYGDITVEGAEKDENQWYTAQFNGTSAAAAVVAGAVASLQGVIRANDIEPYGSLEMRDLIAETGTPQPEDPYGRHIGPLPNLRSAIGVLMDAYGFKPRIQRLVAEGDPTPIGGTFAGFEDPLHVGPDANVMFAATVREGKAPSGIFLAPHDGGPISKIIAQGDGGFNINGPSLNDNGDVTFKTMLPEVLLCGGSSG